MGEIISIGMVKLNGESLYLELEYTDEDYITDWVKKNVLPRLTNVKVSKGEARNQILDFVGNNNPYLVSYVIEFDGAYLYKLLGVNDKGGNKVLPFHWILLDFASMLFAIDIDPTFFDLKKKENLATQLGLDYSGHVENHALIDAKILREIYLKLTSVTPC